MDMHTGSTDEYETDEHHFDGEGDSSDDELVVPANNARVSLVTTKIQKRPLSPKRNDGGAKNDSDNDGLASKQRPRAAASKYGDSSSSEEEITTKTNNNKRVRRALGRVNDNKTNTKNNTPAGNNDSSASNNNNSSDEDSDDLGLGLGSSRQRQAASARKRAALMKMYDDSDDDSDSSDDDSFSAKKRKMSSNLKNKRSVVAAKKPLKKKAIALDDSSDSDDSDSDCVDVTPTKSKRARATRPAAAAAAARSSKTAIDCLSSDSDDDLPPTTRASKPPPTTTTRRTAAFKSDKTDDATQHDPSVRAHSNATLEAAKMARAALLQSQVYHAEDVNLPSLPSQVVPSPKTSSNTNDDVLDLTSTNDNVKSNSTPAPVYTGPMITIYLRYRDSSNKESKVGLKIKMDQPLQHLVDQFQNGKITQMKFDGQNMNLTKTPSFYDMDDEDLIDAVVTADSSNRSSSSAFSTGLPARREETIVIHVRGSAGARNETYQMKKSGPLNKVVNDYCKKNNLESITLEYNGRELDPSQSCAQLNVANDAHLDAVVVGGPSINLKFRINGKANETQNIAIRMKGTFQQAFETFAQRQSVSVSQCKFVFDGETLRPSTTPEQLDLEGDEIIDVKVTETTRPAASTTTQATSRRAAPASAAAAAVAVAVAGPPVMITFETNRNQNNNPRQKKWKLLDTSPVTALKTDYTKYYKSKGCKQVKFYFRDQLITNESQSLRDLGIRNGDRVYAMENGKAYKP